MALQEYTLTQLWTLARDTFTARASDQRLTSLHRAQSAECVQRLDAALADVRPNNTVAPNRKQAHHAALTDRAGVMGEIDRVHPDDLTAAELYNGIDAMRDGVFLMDLDQPSGLFDY